MSNLVYCYPDFLLNGTLTAQPTGTSRYSELNVITGTRKDKYKSSAAVTSSVWTVDLGSGNESRPDYTLLAGAHFLAQMDSADVDIIVSGNSSDSWPGAESETNSFGVSDLKGVLAEDYVVEHSFSSDYRYWRYEISTTDSIVHKLYKLYSGKWYYPGKEPERPLTMSDIGSSITRKSVNRLGLNYSGLSGAKARELTSKLGANKLGSPVFLYARDFNSVLGGYDLMHCRLIEVEYRATGPATYAASLVAVELI